MENTGYKDVDGNDIFVGDIMFNPFFGDYWVVEKYTEQEKEQYDVECDYCLALYGDRDCYFTELDVPSGFKIFCHKDNEIYQQCLEDFENIAKRMLQ